MKVTNNPGKLASRWPGQDSFNFEAVRQTISMVQRKRYPVLHMGSAAVALLVYEAPVLNISDVKTDRKNRNLLQDVYYQRWDERADAVRLSGWFEGYRSHTKKEKGERVWNANTWL